MMKTESSYPEPTELGLPDLDHNLNTKSLRFSPEAFLCKQL
jgi:hypothetical protein